MDTPITETIATASSPVAGPGVIDPGTWRVGVDTLKTELDQHAGCVSSLALRQALEAKGIKDARDVVVQLKFYDFQSNGDDQRPPPSFRWFTHAKSFYSAERFATFKQKQEAEVAQVAQAEAVIEEVLSAKEEEAAPPSERKKIRQEEARLGSYVASALENIYQSDCAPDDSEYVFDVHKERPGSEYENVDVLAVHWRTENHVELIAVEVKLDFTARLVQQARNYARFADRVWIAVPITADAADAAAAVREYDPSLFEHVVETGLGILVCRRRPGKSYEIMPVHWPRRIEPDPIEKQLFLERYRRTFEVARVIEPRGRTRYPKL